MLGHAQMTTYLIAMEPMELQVLTAVTTMNEHGMEYSANRLGSNNLDNI